MKYTGLTYRPPFEANSLLLQVTRGCSHNSCAFCTMYRDTPFGEETLEQIERDIDEASQMELNTRRVFLVNGDAFTLPAQKLARVAEMIGEKLPQIRTISMYASIRNIQEKTDAELRMLRELGVNELNIGVESGMDSVLEYMNKGYSVADAKAELSRLREAGYDYALNIIFGAAGSGAQLEHARKTAQLVNDAQPFLIFTGTVHTDPGCPLYDAVQEGSFVENTIGERAGFPMTKRRCCRRSEKRGRTWLASWTSARSGLAKARSSQCDQGWHKRDLCGIIGRCRAIDCKRQAGQLLRTEQGGNDYEQEAREISAYRSAETGKETGHRYDEGRTGQGQPHRRIPDREAPDRKRPPQEKRLEKRIRTGERTGMSRRYHRFFFIA